MLFLKADVSTPIEFISGGQFVSDIPWTHSRRSIDSFEIIIGVKKSLYIQQNNIQYEVGPGGVHLILPGQIHFGYKECREDITFYWVHFTCPKGYEILDENKMKREVDRLRSNPETYRSSVSMYIPLFSTPPCIDRVNILFRQIQHLAQSNYYTFHGVHYLLTSLLIEISEQTITHFHPSKEINQANKQLAEIQEWIRINALKEDITVSTVAENFNYNRDYLSRLFKQRTNMNLQNYINLVKLSKAKDLLCKTSHSVKGISYSVGISNEKYFMRLFKKYEKMTPTEYRKAYFNTHMNNH
jgi:AraC-like DNA-binding protein